MSSSITFNLLELGLGLGLELELGLELGLGLGLKLFLEFFKSCSITFNLFMGIGKFEKAVGGWREI
jgi:hypothetical protein